MYSLRIFFFFHWKPQVVSLTHKALHTGDYIGLVRCNPPTLSLVTAPPSHAYSSVFGQMQVNRPRSKYWRNVNYFVGRCYTCMTRKIQHPPATYEYVFLHSTGAPRCTSSFCTCRSHTHDNSPENRPQISRQVDSIRHPSVL